MDLFKKAIGAPKSRQHTDYVMVSHLKRSILRHSSYSHSHLSRKTQHASNKIQTGKIQSCTPKTEKKKKISAIRRKGDFTIILFRLPRRMRSMRSYDHSILTTTCRNAQHARIHSHRPSGQPSDLQPLACSPRPSHRQSESAARILSTQVY